MKFKSPPRVWILDFNPSVNAKYQSDKYLNNGIKNLYLILLSTYVVSAGLKNPKFIQYYFNDKDKDKFDESFEKYYIGWPVPDKFKAKALLPTNDYVKWAIKTKDHYDFLVSHLEAFFEEYYLRWNKEHTLNEYIFYFKELPPQKLPKIKLKKIYLPYRNIPFYYRTSDFVTGLRKWYSKKIVDPIKEYSRTNIPDFLIGNTDNLLEKQKT
jgi:hypothetical protein